MSGFKWGNRRWLPVLFAQQEMGQLMGAAGMTFSAPVRSSAARAALDLTGARNLMPGTSAEHFVHGNDLLCHLNQLLLPAHGLSAHQGVGLFFVAVFHFHQ